MRQALNDNPVVQIVVLGIGGVVVALLLLSRLGGSSDPAPSEPTTSASITVTATATGGAATEPSATAGSAGAGDAAATPVTPATPDATAASGDLVAGDGLPAAALGAHEDGKVVVLLVVDERGADDRVVERTTEGVAQRADVALFVVPAKRIASYSRIAQGAHVSRTPALVVVSPLADAEAVPTATVAYGFRDSASVQRAIDDALYDGRTRGYDPG